MFYPGNILISLFALASLSFMFHTIRKPFKSHSFNTFAYIILLLLSQALLVRFFFFFIDHDSIATKTRGFLATYPCINLVISSYLLSNQWVYDLLIFIHGHRNRFLERQVKVFVITSLIFLVIIYFVYSLSLPTSNENSNWNQIYFFIAIF